MQNERDPIFFASKLSPGTAPKADEDMLHWAITQIAAQLRLSGHVESAHFMDIAALALRDQQHH